MELCLTVISARPMRVPCGNGPWASKTAAVSVDGSFANSGSADTMLGGCDSFCISIGPEVALFGLMIALLFNQCRAECAYAAFRKVLDDRQSCGAQVVGRGDMTE